MDMIGNRRNNYKQMQTIVNTDEPEENLQKLKKYHDGHHLAPLNREPRNNSYPRQIDLNEDHMNVHPIDKVAQTARGAKNIPAIDHANHQIKPP